MTDPISDFLTRLRNASKARLDEYARDQVADDQAALLFRQHRAGGVEQRTAGAEQRPKIVEQALLQAGQLANVLLAAQGLDVRMAANHARAGAGGIQQDAVEDWGYQVESVKTV